MSRINLKNSQQPVDIPGSGVRIRAPGLVGDVVWHGPRASSEVRAETAESPLLAEALREAGLEDRHTLEVNAPTPVRSPVYQRILTTDVAPDEIEIDVPTSANELQFAIYTDEDGITTFQFPAVRPKAQPEAPSRAAGGGQVTYRIPLRQAKGVLGETSQSRFIGGMARKVIKIVMRKALKPVAGKAVFAATQLWEDKYRAEQGFHGGSLEELLTSPVSPRSNLKEISGKNALLFVHGTTSTTVGAFQGLKNFPDVAQELYRRYEGRVFGFNHHTLTKCVAQNAADLYDSLGPGNYTFDIISHSRGGLVARSLLELDAAKMSGLIKSAWSQPQGLNVKVNRSVFVGTPNAATDLADPKDLTKVLNRLAAIIGLLKDAPPVLALGAILSIASGFAQSILEGASDLLEAGLKSLPGLVDMSPGCTFLEDLTNADPARYWGIQAQYRADGRLIAALENKGIDIMFRNKANDLIVPTEGVSQTSTFQLAKLTPPHVSVFEPKDGVNHVNYFYQRLTWDSILGFLK
jgi:pimeloyl-ACP methyl ester carboxylesterase